VFIDVQRRWHNNYASRRFCILRKNGYSPDKQEQATRTVLEQVEVLSQEWVVA
jgi:hypothetical protein